MIVQLLVASPFDPGDPTGQNYLSAGQQIPGTELVQAKVVQDHGGGVLDLLLDGGVRLVNVPQGTAIGTWRLGHSINRAAVLATWQAWNAGPTRVKGAAQVLRQVVLGDVPSIVPELLAIANNESLPDADRAQAILYLAIMVLADKIPLEHSG